MLRTAPVRRFLACALGTFAAALSGCAPSGSDLTSPVSDPGVVAPGSGSPSDDLTSTGPIDAPTLVARARRGEDRVDYGDLSPAAAASLSQLAGLRWRVRPVAGFPGLVEYTVLNTGSGWQEKFLLQRPLVTPTAPAPLVVVFHKYGSSHADLLNSGFLPEAIARGWYAICPLGARQRHFGNLESQINTEAALLLTARLYPIDTQRIYGVGFSMGGAAAANYAARHQDPHGLRLAAVCDHTGGVSLGHVWWNDFDDADLDDNVPNVGDNLEAPDVLESLFGGTPAQRPFDYQRSSVIDLDPFTGLVGAGTDFARNLRGVPTYVWRASGEPNAYLAVQTDTFDTHVHAFHPQNQYYLAAGTTHAWGTLDPNAICNWFATQTLATPNSGTALADEDGQWFHFQVEQDAAGAFTRFDWSIDAATKHVIVSNSANTKRLRLDPYSGHGLVLTGPVTLDLSTADATGDQFVFLNVLQAPTAVTRDGVAASGTYDSLAKTFTVVETDAAPHQWVVTFP